MAGRSGRRRPNRERSCRLSSLWAANRPSKAKKRSRVKLSAYERLWTRRQTDAKYGACSVRLSQDHAVAPAGGTATLAADWRLSQRGAGTPDSRSKIGDENLATATTVEPTRRDFLYIATGAVAAVGAAAVVWPLINQMSPDASTLALASTEVDIGAIPEGQIVTDQMARQAGLHPPPHAERNRSGGRRQCRDASRSADRRRPASRSRNG